MSETVLVTGGSGFIGGWVVVELLKRGYAVRTTVRSLDREARIRAAISKEVDPGDSLSFFMADLMNDAGWDDAVEGCDHVLHIAAPVGAHAPHDPEELLGPTREGALRVLRAACRAQVRRVVITSAVEACRPPMTSLDSIVDESRWTDTDDVQIGPYRLAKTLAERTAWDFMARQSGPTTLTTILPAAVQGPVFTADYAGSLKLVQRMLTGKLPRYPNLGFCVVDVRDVADLHIRAMASPDAAGERFIAASDWMWMADIACLLRSELGVAASKVPTRPMADLVLRIAARFNRELQFVVPLLHRKHIFTADKAEAMLGWKPRLAATTIIDSARSALSVGVVKAAT